MSWSRWLLCTLLVAAADGAWLYLLLALLGFMAGLGQSPLQWLVIELVLLVGVVSEALRESVPRAWPARGLLSRVTAVGAVWLAVAGAHGALTEPPGAAWPYRMLSGAMSGATLTAAFLALLASVALWRHAARQARTPVGPPPAARHLRAGLVVFALVLGVEVAGGLDLGTGAVIVPFFACALIAMAVARAPAQRASSRAWLGSVLLGVTAALGGGLALAVTAVALVRGSGLALQAAWLELASYVTESVRAALRELLGGAPASRFEIDTSPTEFPEVVVLLMLLAGAVLVAWGLSRLLDAQAPELPHVVLDLSEEERESIGEADTAFVERLVDSLLPAWLRRRRAAPAGAARTLRPGIREAAALYRRLLELARERGVPLDPADTPYERARRLAPRLPGAPVDAVTRHFVAACYGDEAPPPAEVAVLRRALDAAAAEPPAR